MNKPDILPTLPGQPEKSVQVSTAPRALIYQSGPVSAADSQHPTIQPTRPARPVEAAPYVDPYLFETGYYASPAEQVELTRTAATRIQLRADVENARPKRRK